MMSPTGHHTMSLIEQFLGGEAARGGPYALLGLPADGCTDLDIMTARDRRMRIIDAHAQGQSPAADEVRLALHAATAQLLNPAVRSHLRRGAATNARAAALAGLEQDVILTLAMFGGWTRRSLPRLMALAHSRGLRASDVAETLRRMSRRKKSANQSSTDGAGSDTKRYVAACDAHSGTGAAWIIAFVAMVMVIGTAWIVVVITKPNEMRRSSQTTSPLTQVQPPSGDSSSPLARDDTAPSINTARTPRVTVERDAILETLLNAISTADSDLAGATDSAVAATDALANHWLDLSVPVRTRALDAIVELMYRLGGPTGDARELLNAVGRSSIVLRSRQSAFDVTEIESAVWSVGALARLRRERDLSAQSHATIDRWLSASLDGNRPAQLSFSGGALACLQSLMEPLAAQAQNRGHAWAGWSRAAVAITQTEPERRVSLLSRAAERLMMQPIGPEERRDMYQAISAVIAALPWAGNDDSKRWLVRQFDNRDVSASSLSSATRTIVAQTDAEHIDPTMVLSESATDLDRRNLRDRYLLAWGLETPGSDIAVLDALTKAADQLDQDLQSVKETSDTLRAAVGFARLNAAAAAQWQGDASAATLILNAYRVAPIAAAGSPVDLNQNAQDGRWAERYLLAGANTALRTDLLNELRTGGHRQIGTVDAEVLVDAALRGGGRAVRDVARSMVDLYGSSPSIVNALLEEAPRLTPTQQISDLVVSVTGQPLPGWTSPEWRLAVRRALVERLLQLIASDSIVAGVDDLAALLDEAYDQRAHDQQSMSSAGDAIVPNAERSVRDLRARWTRAAERSIPAAGFPLTLADVARRLEGRRGLASGLVQEFAVEQLALAETMAVVIVSERPVRSNAVNAVLDDLGHARREATHIFDQIAATERAMIQLWEIRLGVNGL